jgi:tRNA (adenine37-N6)-methyltransferase
MASSELDQLKSQLKVARDEIANLRSQINSLNHVNRKEIDGIRNKLKDFRCGDCTPVEPKKEAANERQGNSIIFKPIGVIRTVFSEKRAVPRQANIAEAILSRVELSKDFYTNPELCLETLDDFSHFWIIYHFHKNESHPKPLISPPRLDGKKVGVLATRSPHRPNPIGMSLVRLDRIEGSTIFFYGSDMVDETPVIDIKPYIPIYDSPHKTVDLGSSGPSTPTNTMKSREEPEGEEDELIAQALPKKPEPVKVPDWISNGKLLKVIFSDNALQQIQELSVNRKSIEEILENDPRSVYVREKYLSQIYNFQVDGNNVMCKFDDKLKTVSVLQIRKLQSLTE